MSFIKNKYVKLDKTYIDMQDHFKVNLLNIKDVLGRLTSKIHETGQTAYINYNNSFKDLESH